MRRGFFLSFEGLDGSGKTTQLRLLAASLEEQGLPVLVTRQPGDTALGERIRALLLNNKTLEETKPDSKAADIAPMAEMALMFADRAQSIRQIIAPALAAGQIVLCDRFTDSPEAYQGGGRELGSEVVLALHRLLCNDLQPDLTILLLPDLEASMARARGRRTTLQTGKETQGASEADRFEQENKTFYAKVFAKYQVIAARETARVVALQGDLSMKATQERILQVVQERLQERERTQQESAPSKPFSPTQAKRRLE